MLFSGMSYREVRELPISMFWHLYDEAQKFGTLPEQLARIRYSLATLLTVQNWKEKNVKVLDFDPGLEHIFPKLSKKRTKDRPR